MDVTPERQQTGEDRKEKKKGEMRKETGEKHQKSGKKEVHLSQSLISMNPSMTIDTSEAARRVIIF